MFFVLVILIALIMACSPDDKGKEQQAFLDQAIKDTKNLIHNSSIGNSEGTFSVKALTELNNSLKQAETVYKSSYSTIEEYTNEADNLYNACTKFEISVITSMNTDLVDSLATKETIYLYHNLKNQVGKGLLFGAQDPTGHGVGWSNDNERSDIKDVTGSYPAVFGWDYLTFFQNPATEKDFVYRIKFGYKNNAITTICWHQLDPEKKQFYIKDINYNVVETLLPGGKYHNIYNGKLKKIAYFAKSVRNSKGQCIPVIFRPYHEHNGDWFWWGKGNCSEEQFKNLWQYTVTYLRDSMNVHNFIYCFSPSGSRFDDKESYMWNYPGDKYVDILGLDYYFNIAEESDKKNFPDRLKNVVDNAIERKKLAALTETGNEKIVIKKFFTEYLLKPLMADQLTRQVVYAVVWRNDNSDHHYAPYPGHPSVADFMDFYNNNFTVFAKDIYNYHELQ